MQVIDNYSMLRDNCAVLPSATVNDSEYVHCIRGIYRKYIDPCICCARYVGRAIDKDRIMDRISNFVSILAPYTRQIVTYAIHRLER